MRFFYAWGSKMHNQDNIGSVLLFKRNLASMHVYFSNIIVVLFFQFLFYGFGIADTLRLHKMNDTQILDYLIQNVSTDENWNPLESKSSRDLKFMEILPYNKYDWPDNSEIDSRIHGYQISNSIPFLYNGLTLVAQSFDFGTGDRAFNRFDEGDGGQIAGVSDWGAYLLGTYDASGPQAFVGRQCSFSSERATENSWLLFSSSKLSGSQIANMRIVRNGKCPTNYADKLTVWHNREISYRISLSGKMSKPISSFITEQYVGAEIIKSPSMERQFFTKELGLTRWEAWRNLSAQQDSKQYEQRSNKIMNGGRCGERIDPPSKEFGEWKMVDCREWTNISQFGVEKQDYSISWTKKLLDDPLVGKLFRLPIN